MFITQELITQILEAIRQPTDYVVDICSVIEHGKGLVVNYMVTPPDSRYTEYRCTGFRRYKGTIVTQAFDMLVDRGAI